MTPGWERVTVEMEKVKETITCVFICVCVCVYLQLLQQVKVLLSEALIGPLQLCSSLVLVEGRGCVQ